MSEAPATTMRAAIGKAIDEFLASTGGGFRMAYVYAVDVVDADGESALFLGGPDEQETFKSVGLTSYLEKWFDVEARELIARSTGCCSDCDEAED